MNIFNDKAREGMTNGDIQDWVKINIDTGKSIQKYRAQLSFRVFHY